MKQPGELLNEAADWIEANPERVIRGEFEKNGCYCLLGRVCAAAGIPPTVKESSLTGNWSGVEAALNVSQSESIGLAYAFDKAVELHELPALLANLRARNGVFKAVPPA